MVGDPVNIHVEMWLIVLKLPLVPDIYVCIARALSRLRLSWLWLFTYMNMIIFFWLEGPFKYTYIYNNILSIVGRSTYDRYIM